MYKNTRKAMEHLRKLREMVAKHPSPIFKMSKEEAIKKLRETREKLWEEKLALRH